MKPITRRRLITTGLAATAGAAGLTAAAKLSKRYGLIPPDHCGVYGPGETFTYAAQRVLTTNSMAREFPRSHDLGKALRSTATPPHQAISSSSTRPPASSTGSLDVNGHGRPPRIALTMSDI